MAWNKREIQPGDAWIVDGDGYVVGFILKGQANKTQGIPRYVITSGGWEEGFVGVDGEPYISWDDLRFPAQAINPIGAVSDPAVTTSETTYPGTLEFSGSQDNMIAGVAQMPHSWAQETEIRPHIHWMKDSASANAVTWEFYYRIIGSAGSTPGAWVGPVSGTLAAGDHTVAGQPLVTSFGSVDMVGQIESAMVAWRVYRRGSSDAFSGIARLLEFDIHFQADKPGTHSYIPD